MKAIKLNAPAKINLLLDIIKLLPNGYHSLFMVMQSVDLCDEVEVTLRDDGKITLECSEKALPTDEKNIAYKAAVKFFEASNLNFGADIKLTKNIPFEAGLAGGSTDAAAVLKALNTLCKTKLTNEELCRIGVKLGADVPYCIMRGTVLAEGIGEILTPLPAMPKCAILIAKPNISVSTKMVYEALDAKEIERHPDIEGILDGLEKGDLARVASSMGNVLEAVTIERYPVIEEIKTAMKEEGALNAMMSGSGPTVFGIFEDKTKAREAQQHLRQKRLAGQVYVANVHVARRG